MKTAIELQQLADICEERGDYAKASRLHQKALSAAERAHGFHSVELLPYLYNDAMIALALDETARARNSLMRLRRLYDVHGASPTDVEEVQHLLFDLEKHLLAANA